MKKDLLILSSKKYPEELTIYDVEKVENITNLYYSKIKKGWTFPGQLAYSVINHGNGFTFTDHKTEETFELNYTVAEALRALLKLQDTDGSTFELLERK